jgi:hypothetical protein
MQTKVKSIPHTFPNCYMHYYSEKKGGGRLYIKLVLSAQTSPDMIYSNCIPNYMMQCFATRCLNQGSSRFWGGVRVAHIFGFLSCLFVFVCLRSVTCASNVASVSGLSILYCPLRFSGTFI